MQRPFEARSRTLRLYRASQTARQASQAVRPRTAACCPQTTQRPTAARASRRRLAASLSRFAVSGWQSAQRRRPGAGDTLPHSMQVERSACRRWRSVRTPWARRRATRQASQLVLPSAGAFRPQRRQRPARRRLSRNRCLRARLASLSFSRQVAQRRGPGVEMAAPQSRHCPRLYMRSRRLRSDLRELARRRSMLSGQQLVPSAGLAAWQPQLAGSAGGCVSGRVEAGMQGMGSISCWRTGAGAGRPTARGTCPDNPFPNFAAVSTGAAVRQERQPSAASGRPGAQAGTATVRIGGQIGRPAIGARSFGLSRDALDGVTGREAKGAAEPKIRYERAASAGRIMTGRWAAAPILPASATAGSQAGAGRPDPHCRSRHPQGPQGLRADVKQPTLDRLLHVGGYVAFFPVPATGTMP